MMVTPITYEKNDQKLVANFSRPYFSQSSNLSSYVDMRIANIVTEAFGSKIGERTRKAIEFYVCGQETIGSYIIQNPDLCYEKLIQLFDSTAANYFFNTVNFELTERLLLQPQYKEFRAQGLDGFKDLLSYIREVSEWYVPEK